MASQTPDASPRPKLVVNDILTDKPADRKFRNILYGLIPFEYKQSVQKKFTEKLHDPIWAERIQLEVSDKLINGFDRWDPLFRGFFTVLFRQAATVMVYTIRDYQLDRIPELVDIDLENIKQLEDVKQRWKHVKDFNYRLLPEFNKAPEIPDNEHKKYRATLGMLFKLGKTFGLPGELACLAPHTSLDLIVETFRESFPEESTIRMPMDLRNVLNDYKAIPSPWLQENHMDSRLSAFFFVWEELAANAGRLRYWLKSLSDNDPEADPKLKAQEYQLFQDSIAATKISAGLLVKNIKKVQDHLDKYHVPYLKEVEGKSFA